MYSNDKRILTQDFVVIKDYGEDEPFFRLQTEHGEVRLMKLPFQKKEPLPDTLNCRVKGYKGEFPIIGHNMPMYVNEFYADGYSQNKEFEFKVVSRPVNGGSYYRLEDSNGLQFKIRESGTPMSVGQTVRCKFTLLDPNVYLLRRSIDDSKLQMVTMRDIAKIVGVKTTTMDKVEARMRQIPELNGAMGEYDHGLSSWIVTAARSIRHIAPKWFSSVVEEMPAEMLKQIIDGFKKVLLYLLEGSRFLRDIVGEERTSMQKEITGIIEMVQIYSNAFDIIRRHEQKTFIYNLLYHLKESGYIFHPNEQFSIMMILFRTSPELVNSSLGSIFDTLMGWYPDTWKAEPFRQAFVEQLEIYISETRADIDNFLLPETPADNEKIEKVLTAIAIQQSLAKESDGVDMRLNMSLFYRCLSLLRSAKADVLLNKSYLALMNVKLPTDFTWSDIKEPTMMMTRAAVDPPANAVVSDDYTKYYMSGPIEVEVNSGISVRRMDEDAPQLVPNGVLPWLNLNVYANISHQFNRQKIKNLEGHVEFWKDVEESLFNTDDQETYTSTKLSPDIDDEVRIEIDRVIYSAADPSHIEAFHCKIVDDHFIEGEGVIKADKLVSYNLHNVSAGVFRNDKGQPLRFDAKVDDIDLNDVIHFSLLDACRMAVPDMTFSGDTCYAVITKDNGRCYSAISEKGFGLFIDKDPSMPPFRNGNVVFCSVTNINNNIVQAVAEEGPIDGMILSNANSLHKLMMAVAVPDDDDMADIQLEDDDELTLQHEDMLEIIQALRYKAVSRRENIIEAYDYLSFAHLLARIAKDDVLANTIKAHKDMLLLHQHYAKNKTVYLEDIEAVELQAPTSVLIKRMASKLRIVASLGHDEDNAALWAISANSTDDTEKELARMVLSYNLLNENGGDDDMCASIKDKIAKTLNVSSEQRSLKYYGTESQYVEFKSSLVYPAGKGKSGISVADPDKQEHEILHIIAGFMNTTGGTLYIGVNDDHYERGLEEDFKFYKLDQSERNTPHRRSIKSLDNMANYLQNVIDRAFNIGANAGDYAKTSIDEESTKGVVVVKIDACPHIVTLNDVIYTRHGAKTEPYTKQEEIDRFIADRRLLFQQQKSALKPIEAEASPEKEEVEPQEKAIEPQEQEIQVEEAQEVAESDTVLPDYSVTQTSTLRKNVLHEYNDPEHFITPNFYIRFVDDHDYIVTDDEWSIDDTERMTLAVTDEEAKEYLLLVFEDENAIKVPMRELDQKRKNTTHSHYSDKRLLFACPVHEDDALYSLHVNAKGTVYERMTPIEEIPTGSMTSTPTRILEVECSTPLWEVVPASKTNEFANIKSTTLKRTQIGVLAKGVKSAKTSIIGAADVFFSKFK